MTNFGAWATGVAMLLVLGACNGKTSAVARQGSDGQGRDGTAFAGAGAASGLGGSGSGQTSTDPRDQPVPLFNGKPIWAANRKHTAEENAQYQFTKNGAQFAAANETQYVADAHAFVDKPPRGVEEIDRPNGDKLLYDPKTNVFAVEARNGAPRTLFKPKDGAAYWQEQKTREAKRAKSGAESDQGAG
ncbi:MAG: hypothetical protein KGL69_04455 [Alphaproteobacteria bacterium]|jgi:hypothetical protein|nr:hypothetical protein [Alphaproteobacteria bacterium]